MSDVTIVRLMVAMAAFLAAGVLYLLWVNAAAADAAKSAAIVVAAFIPILVTALPYVRAPKIEDSVPLVLFLDNDNKEITFGRPGNQYWAQYYLPLTLHQSDLRATSLEQITDGDSALALDLLELLVVQKLSLPFGSHWNIDIHETQLAAGASTATYSPKDENEPKTVLPADELRAILSNNHLSGFISSSIALPPNAHIKETRKSGSRTISITSPYATLTAEISFDGMALMNQQRIPYLDIDGIAQPRRYYAAHWTLKTKFEPAWFRGYSPQATAYGGWYKNVMYFLRKLSWQEIGKQIDTDLQREAAERTLGITPSPVD